MGKSVWALTLALLLSGCAVGPDYQPTQTPAYQQWLESRQPGISETALDEGAWWRRYQDPLLDRYVERALDDNLSLQIMAQRADQARHYQKAVSARRLPSIGLSAGYSRARYSDLAPLMGPLASDDMLGQVDNTQDTFNVGLAIAWEADVFGGVQRAIEASGARAEQVAHLRDGVALVVASTVVDNYLQLRGAQARLALIEDNIALQQRTLAIVEKQFQAGLARDVDVAQAEAQLASTRAMRPMVDTAIRAHMHRLALLQGDTPAALVTELAQATPLPSVQGLIPVGLPSDLLQRRPDIRAAEQGMVLANAQIGVAIANQYPKFYLTGTPGVSASDFDALFKTGTESWLFRAGISWNLFDGGASQAMVDAADANFQAAMLSYQQTVLSALAEVETLLTAYGNSQQQLQALLKAESAAKRASQKALSLYEAGLVNYLIVLDAQRTLNTVQDQRIQTEILVAGTASNLHKALGGGWG